MKISTKGRYGLRILLDIAVNQDRGPVNIRDIGRRQAISEKYLWQVVNRLKGAGLVQSVRGAKGGYMLAKAPERITVEDAVSVLEGPLILVACSGEQTKCERSEQCVTRGVWAELEQKIHEVMSSITLSELVKRHKDAVTNTSPSYVI